MYYPHPPRFPHTLPASYYRAWWRNDPTSLEILPGNWNSPVPTGTQMNAVVFSSAASVRLVVNGKDLGAKPVPPYGVVNYPGVTFLPGNITAVSYNAAGDVLATHTVSTTGAAVALRMAVEPGSEALRADGADVGLVRVEVIDAAGRIVPDASHTITFAVTAGGGSIYGVGNGDPSDHSPDKASVRAAWMGLARVLVQAGETPGQITLTASAPGLTGATVYIAAQ